jgi:predicted Zn finger-like uncharacterized protein
MLVSCPKCSSRYKLPDDKIRPSGTKVRCPKCQNTFRVFPETEAPKSGQSSSPFSDVAGPTEAVVRQEVLDTKKKKPVAPPPAVKNDSDDFEFMEGAKTMVSPRQQDAPAALNKSKSKKKEASPFKRPAVSDEYRESDIDEATEFQEQEQSERQRIESVDDQSMRDDNDPSSSQMRPFGDATFAEIQQAGGRPKKTNKKIMIAAAVVIAITLLTLMLPNFKSRTLEVVMQSPTKNAARPAPQNTKANENAQNTGAQNETPLIKKSSAWYRDEPAFLQDYLTQMATLPISEQQKPENRALLADALISNGMLTGAEDQIMSGLGISSALLAGYPNFIYGFFGLSSYAMWKEEVANLTDLVKMWPAAYQAGAEYRLSKAIIDARTGSPKAGLDAFKTILSEYPDFYRAQLWAVLISLDHAKEGEEVFGKPKLQEFIHKFEKKRLNTRSGAVPTLYQSIEKRLKKKGLPVADAEPKEQIAHKAEKSTAEIPKKSAVATIKETKGKADKKGDKSKKLPKPEPELIALNQQTSKMKQTALKLFEEGNLRQKENKVEEAITLYQNALREDPDLADVYKQLGVIYMNRQEKDRALRAFKIYLQLKPESDDRQVVQGWISSMQ